VSLPLILGLNNPQGNEPLCPEPPGCAGHRLWLMVHEETGISVREWLRRTQRINLLSDRVLPLDYRGAARRRGAWLAGHIGGRTVVLLGNAVAAAVGHVAPPLVWDGTRDWVMIPHPSGRTLFYNNPVHRAAVGIMLADVLRGTDLT
jgi:hypothetical protein